MTWKGCLEALAKESNCREISKMCKTGPNKIALCATLDFWGSGNFRCMGLGGESGNVLPVVWHSDHQLAATILYQSGPLNNVLWSHNISLWSLLGQKKWEPLWGVLMALQNTGGSRKRCERGKYLHCFSICSLDLKGKREIERKMKCGGAESAELEHWQVEGAEAGTSWSKRGSTWQAASGVRMSSAALNLPLLSQTFDDFWPSSS